MVVWQPNRWSVVSVVHKTTLRFSDSLGLTERGRAIVLMVIVYYRKKVQLKIKSKGKWKECKRDQV